MKSPNRISDAKLLLFDVGNTIVDAEHLIYSSAKHAADELTSRGLVPQSNVLLDSYLTASRLASHEHVNRIFSDSKIVQSALNLASLSDDERSILFFVTLFRKKLRSLLIPDQELIASLNELKRQGFSLCVVSDGTTFQQYELLDKIGVLFLFDCVFVSESFGEEKTSTKIFEAILNFCSVRADQAIMIGDDIERDMVWAHKTGYTTVLQEQYVQHPPNILDRFSLSVDYRINKLVEFFDLLTN